MLLLLLVANVCAICVSCWKQRRVMSIVIIIIGIKQRGSQRHDWRAATKHRVLQHLLLHHARRLLLLLLHPLLDVWELCNIRPPRSSHCCCHCCVVIGRHVWPTHSSTSASSPRSPQRAWDCWHRCTEWWAGGPAAAWAAAGDAAGVYTQ